jgi:hypothetical protein
MHIKDHINEDLAHFVRQIKEGLDFLEKLQGIQKTSV